MTFKCFIFLSALQSALLCNSSQLTNHRESTGHIGTKAWVGVSPQAVWLHVGWNSLFSTEYSFGKAHNSSSGLPLQILIISKERGNTRWISPNLRNTTGYNPHAETTWQKEIYSSDTQTRPVATGALYGRIHFNIALHHSKSDANTPPTHALHILQKHHPRITITGGRGIQYTLIAVMTLEYGLTSKIHQENANVYKVENLSFK